MQTKAGNLNYYSAYIGRERQDDAAFPHLGHRLIGLRAGTQMPISPQVGLFATVALENRTYLGPDPLFSIPATPTTPFIPVTRSDNQFDLSIGAAWKLSDTWRLTPQLNYNRSKSNLAVNDSSKTSVSVTARRDF
jgi:hypothetical protein